MQYRLFMTALLSSFSTLHAGRVAATAVPPIHDRPPLFFQYPPCGSSRCNARHRPGATGMTTLSVPSMRVESLQRIGRDEDRPIRILFQYPPCGSSRCNRKCPYEVKVAGKLSVPSMRVESLQPRSAP